MGTGIVMQHDDAFSDFTLVFYFSLGLQLLKHLK
jgi:hypothetical protein